MPYGEKGEGKKIEQNENDSHHARGDCSASYRSAGAFVREAHPERDAEAGSDHGSGVRDHGSRGAGVRVLCRAESTAEEAPLGDAGGVGVRLYTAAGESSVFRRGLRCGFADCRLLHGRGIFGQFDSGGKTSKICLNRKWTIAGKLAKHKNHHIWCYTAVKYADIVNSFQNRYKNLKVGYAVDITQFT